MPSLSFTFDLVVVEATPAGIAMAVRAAREGMTVLLTSRGRHIGGMLTSGLGVWDGLHEGRRALVYDEVRQAIQEHYRTAYGEHSHQYTSARPAPGGHRNGCFEPSVAGRVLERLVAAEPHLTVWRECRLGEVEAVAERVVSVRLCTPTEGERTVVATVFADCSYEGDFAALAGVPFRVGREGRDEYGEPHAGWIHTRPADRPSPDQAAFVERRRAWALRRFDLFQEVVSSPAEGSGDDRVQAYNYRTILTDDPANRVAIGRPDDYDRSRHVGVEYDSLVGPLPNRKVSWNRPQLAGVSKAYPNGGDYSRSAIRDAHWNATLGLLYFLQNDEAVPASVRTAWSVFGLAADEFADNGHRPYEIYVREARRIVGRTTLTEHDFLPSEAGDRPPSREDAIAGTDWYVDVHACGPERIGDGYCEGKLMLHHETVPGQVPYGAILPGNRDNLLVPVCLSASHVAFSAVRVEPVWMAVGEAAGFAAAAAWRAKTAPAHIDVGRLRETLRAAGIVTEPFGLPSPSAEETVPLLSVHGH